MPTPTISNGIVLDRINRCPPFLIYYLSHRGRGQRLRISELHKDAGMPNRTFTRIAQRKNWNGVKVGAMEKFCLACGLNPMESDRVMALLKEELTSESPFQAFPVRCRAYMIRRLNLLCAQSILGDGA